MLMNKNVFMCVIIYWNSEKTDLKCAFFDGFLWIELE